MIIKLLTLIFLISSLYPQSYCAGDIINTEDQSELFNVCYPQESIIDSWQLINYNGSVNGGDYHIIFMDLSATWCTPCYYSIDCNNEPL